MPTNTIIQVKRFFAIFLSQQIESEKGSKLGIKILVKEVKKSINNEGSRIICMIKMMNRVKKKFKEVLANKMFRKWSLKYSVDALRG